MTTRHGTQYHRYDTQYHRYMQCGSQHDHSIRHTISPVRHTVPPVRHTVPPVRHTVPPVHGHSIQMLPTQIIQPSAVPVTDPNNADHNNCLAFLLPSNVHRLQVAAVQLQTQCRQATLQILLQATLLILFLPGFKYGLAIQTLHNFQFPFLKKCPAYIQTMNGWAKPVDGCVMYSVQLN